VIAPDREEVGPDELLSRHIFNPPMFPGGELLARCFFEFPGGQCESVLWRRHVAEGLEGVHRMGCDRQSRARDRQAHQGKIPDKTYIGAATARAADISCYRNPNGHGLKIIHEPSEGRSHVHICYDSLPGARQMDRSDKNEIKEKLVEIFSDVSYHVCP
jgi:hypothetical protein